MMPFQALRMRNPSIVPSGDPHWANVVFLSGFNRNTVNDSTSFTEESSKARTVVATGTSAFTTNTNPKFGVGSLYAPTPGGVRTKYYWTVADNDDWSFGSSPFTVEAWVSFANSPASGVHRLLGQYNTSTNQRSWALTVEAGVLQLLLSTAGTSGTAIATSAWAPTLNTYYHVAADYDGTAYRTYVDGVMKGKSVTSLTLFNSSANLAIGAVEYNLGANTDFVGYMDEVRITKGVARYASDSGFTPPTAAFPRS